MKEDWKDIEGYEGLYQVSCEGRVRSLERVVRRNGATTKTLKSVILKPQKQANGYLFACLSKNGERKQFLIHRLVAKAFISGHGEVNHIDEDKTNNCVSNLEWVTHSENIRHGSCISRRSEHSDFKGSNNPMYGRKGKDNPHSMPIKQYDLSGNFVKEYDSAATAGRELNISSSSICRCANGFIQKCGGYIWKR